MTEEQFWALISEAQAAQPDEPGVWLAERLGGDADQLVAFDHWWLQKVYAAYTWRLWDAACVLFGGCSDDGFWEFRNALVGMGRAAYEAIVADPDAIVDWVADEDDFYEQTEALADLHYLVQATWRKAAGTSEDDAISHADLQQASQPMGPARVSSDDEDADLRASVPRAMAKWGDDDSDDNDNGEPDTDD